MTAVKKKKKSVLLWTIFVTASLLGWSATFDRDTYSSLSPSGAKHSKSEQSVGFGMCLDKKELDDGRGVEWGVRQGNGQTTRQAVK